MARRTFISYKYSDSVGLRDAIIKSLGKDAKFYNGERHYNDLSNDTDSRIQNYLKEMIFGTSVTIVIISANIKKSDWIEWEIEYSLKNIPRDERISRRNGIVCVLDDYISSIFQNNIENIKNFLFPVILRNIKNKKSSAPYFLSSNYIDFVKAQDFLSDPNKYIEEAYQKSCNENLYDVGIHDEW